MFFKFYQKYKADKRESMWKNGYDWAAGALLRKELTPMSLSAYIDSADKDAFDLGAEDACNYLIILNIIEDDLELNDKGKR